jgi:O-antigen/teichoic acid export membrane protein
MAFTIMIGNLIAAIFKLSGVFISARVNVLLLFLLFGSTVGGAVQYFSLTRRVKIRFSAPLEKQRLAGFLRAFGAISVLNFMILFMQNSDVLLMRLLFSDMELGIYSVPMIFGKALFFAATALAPAVFTYTLKNKSDGAKTKPLYLISIGLIFAGTAVCFLIAVFLGEPIITRIFLKDYASCSGYIIPAVLFGAGSSLCYVSAYYLYAIGNTKLFLIICLFGNIGAVALSSVIGSRLGGSAVIWLLAAIYSVIFLTIFIFILLSKRGGKETFSYEG